VHITARQRLLFDGNRERLRPEALAATLEFVTSSIACRGILIPCVVVPTTAARVSPSSRRSVSIWCFSIFSMPKMDRRETMRPVCELQPAIPNNAMSGRPPDSRSEPDVRAVTTKLGAVGSRLKAFKPAALPAMIAECLAAAAKPSAQPTPDSNVASRR
jgi:hypothetical protein